MVVIILVERTDQSNREKVKLCVRERERERERERIFFEKKNGWNTIEETKAGGSEGEENG